MAIADRDKIADLSKTFQAAQQDAFLRVSASQPQMLFTKLIPADTQSVEQLLVVHGASVREHTSAPKVFSPAKAFKLAIPFRKFHFGLEIDKDDVTYDRTGAVEAMLRSFAEDCAPKGDGQIILDEFVSNSGEGPVGIDGVNLIDTAHAMLTGSNQSNKGTTALSFAQYDVVFQAMQNFLGHDAQPLGITPTHLMVGPKLRKLGMEITGSDQRIIAVDNAGVETGTRVAASTIPNVFGGGQVDLIVWDKLTGTYDDYWYLMDLSKSSKPMALAVQMDWETLIKDRPDDDNVFHDDKVLALIQAHKSPAAGAWPLIYGNIVS